MIREINTDFNKMKEYIADYSIEDKATNKDFLSKFKTIHKHYYAIVVFGYELKFLYNKNSDILDERIKKYILEIVSLSSSVVFGCIHGDYRSSLIVSRTIVEFSVRVLLAKNSVSAFNISNVYQLFDAVKEENLYTNSKEIRTIVERLHSEYRKLCSYVHSDVGEMTQEICSLAHFPGYDNNNFTITRRVTISVLKDTISLLCLIYSKLFHRMHPKNRKIILSSIESKNRRIIMLGEIDKFA